MIGGLVNQELGVSSVVVKTKVRRNFLNRKLFAEYTVTSNSSRSVLLRYEKDRYSPEATTDATVDDFKDVMLDSEPKLASKTRRKAAYDVADSGYSVLSVGLARE